MVVLSGVRPIDESYISTELTLEGAMGRTRELPPTIPFSYINFPKSSFFS